MKSFPYASFDIFDTLLVREVAKPQDVWRYMEEKYNKPNFANLRLQAEIQTRNQNPQLGEVTLDMIYKNLHQQYIQAVEADRD